MYIPKVHSNRIHSPGITTQSRYTVSECGSDCVWGYACPTMDYIT